MWTQKTDYLPGSIEKNRVHIGTKPRDGNDYNEPHLKHDTNGNAVQMKLPWQMCEKIIPRVSNGDWRNRYNTYQFQG